MGLLLCVEMARSCLITICIRYPELLPLTVNLVMIGIALAQREFGKATYWLGAAVLTVGLMKMKG